MSVAIDITRHPCFNVKAKGTCGRVHLPVAPQCNIKCNYCNRKYDCVNESRPGVTSAVLAPEQAVLYLDEVLEKAPNITVAGIAGPGDAFANPEVTLETLRLIRERFPQILICLASNGLNLAPYVEELARLKVSHVTVTVNAVDPEIGAKIYAWARDGKVIYRGFKAAELLLERQLVAIQALKEAGIVVKVNTIVIPGVNDHHVLDVAKRMAELGVDIQNCMTMFPNSGTPFQDIPEPTSEQMARIRAAVKHVIPQMEHCTRCRADAVGLLDEDRSGEFMGCLSRCAGALTLQTDGRPYVAVATLEGMLVNQHLGEAHRFQIWARGEDGYHLIGERPAPEPGAGAARWLALADTLKDCRAVLVAAMGETPRQILMESHVVPVEMNGFIQMGLDAVYEGRDLSVMKGRRMGCGKGAGCSGDGGGCG